MYATRGDLRQHVTKVHRCGIYAKMPAGGLSIRQRSYSSSLKNSQRTSGSSNSPIKQQQRRRETVYRCSMCASKFPHVRAIERHLYDVHHIDPFDTEAMKNATIPGEEEVDDADEQQQQLEDTSLELNSSRRDEDEQMAIIQFRNQSQHADQSPLIVKIERGASADQQSNPPFHFIDLFQMVTMTSKPPMISSPINQRPALDNCKRLVEHLRSIPLTTRPRISTREKISARPHTTTR